MSSFPEHPGYTERREVAKKSLCRCCLMPSRRLCVCGASFMAAAAPKPLLPGCNRLACCFNKRGWFGGHEEERQRGEERERERERESHSSKLIQTPEVGERERERERGWMSMPPFRAGIWHMFLRAVKPTFNTFN